MGGMRQGLGKGKEESERSIGARELLAGSNAAVRREDAGRRAWDDVLAWGQRLGLLVELSLTPYCILCSTSFRVANYA